MCGIFGLAGKITTETPPAKIFESFNKLKLRGPDRSLTVDNHQSFIGFHRLAINGLDIDGDQPFHLVDGDKTFYLVCNGEIFNFRELINTYQLKVSKTGSDCAVLLPLYQLFNYDVERLNKELIGEYAFAIVEFDFNKLNSVTLSTDPLAVRPMFFAHNEDFTSFGFSSLLAGLSGHFEEVKRLNQKQLMVWKPGKPLVVKTYWDKVINLSSATHDATMADYEKAVTLFENAVKRRLISDRQIGCLLSGGLDSSLVCAVAAKLMAEYFPGKKLKTFSIGMREGTDIQYAQQVADHVNRLYNNIEHTVVYFTAEEGLGVIDEVINAAETFDITTIRASVGQFLLGKYISTKSDAKVVLNGDGADEGQMGYLYFYLQPDALSGQEDSYKLLDEIHLYDGLRVDRAISCNGLEARVPFLDREFVDYFRGLPAEWKRPTSERMEKYFLRKAFAEVYKDSPLLPEEVLWRKKEAFSDGVSGKEKSWFELVKEYMAEKVSDEEFESEKGKLNPELIAPSKEAFYYQKKFKSLFGEQWKIISHYWLPNWSGNIQEPSARVLKVYESTNNN